MTMTIILFIILIVAGVWFIRYLRKNGEELCDDLNYWNSGERKFAKKHPIIYNIIRITIIIVGSLYLFSDACWEYILSHMEGY